MYTAEFDVAAQVGALLMVVVVIYMRGGGIDADKVNWPLDVE